MSARKDTRYLDQLPLLDPVRGQEPSVRERAAARADLERILAGARTAPVGAPAARTPTPQRLAVAGALLATAGVVAVVALATGNPAEPRPTRPGVGTPAPAATDTTGLPREIRREPLTTEQVKQAAEASAQQLGGEGDWGGNWHASDVLLAAPGPGLVLTLMRRGSTVAVCEYQPTAGTSGILGCRPAEETAYPEPAAGAVDVLAGSVDGPAPTITYAGLVGRAGKDVRSVDVVLRNGTTLSTTLAGGWWAVQWPDRFLLLHPELRTGWKVVVHAEDGTRSVLPDTDVIVRPAPRR
jgi:hypothetical protein